MSANDLGPGLGGQHRHQLHFTEEETEARRNFMCQDCPRQLGSQWSADQAQRKLLEGEASVVCALSSPPPGVGVRGHSLTVSSLSQAGSQQTGTEHPPWLAGAVLGARGGKVNMAARTDSKSTTALSVTHSGEGNVPSACPMSGAA